MGRGKFAKRHKYAGVPKTSLASTKHLVDSVFKQNPGMFETKELAGKLVDVVIDTIKSTCISYGDLRIWGLGRFRLSVGSHSRRGPDGNVHSRAWAKLKFVPSVIFSKQVVARMVERGRLPQEVDTEYHRREKDDDGRDCVDDR